ncbi:hypothetical protein SSCG_02961, partial [Streptomyces clavuligerus]
GGGCRYGTRPGSPFQRVREGPLDRHSPSRTKISQKKKKLTGTKNFQPGPLLTSNRRRTKEGPAAINGSSFRQRARAVILTGTAARPTLPDGRSRAGMVGGESSRSRCPSATHSFGGLERDSLLRAAPTFYGNDGVRFYTRGKVVTTRWPDPSEPHAGVDLGFPAQPLSRAGGPPLRVRVHRDPHP